VKISEKNDVLKLLFACLVDQLPKTHHSQREFSTDFQQKLNRLKKNSKSLKRNLKPKAITPGTFATKLYTTLLSGWFSQNLSRLSLDCFKCRDSLTTHGYP
jgi:hypothetical protein